MPDQPEHQKSSQVHYSSPHRAGETTSSFDELAKGLASGTLSRGKALRLLGGALVGGALASLPGVAWARGGGGDCPYGQELCGGVCVVECPEGQVRDFDCTCSSDVCPPEIACCCTCLYEDPATGAGVATCQDSVSNDFQCSE